MSSRLEEIKLSWNEQAKHLNIHAWRDIEFLLSRVEAAEKLADSISIKVQDVIAILNESGTPNNAQEMEQLIEAREALTEWESGA